MLRLLGAEIWTMNLITEVINVLKTTHNQPCHANYYKNFYAQAT